VTLSRKELFVHRPRLAHAGIAGVLTIAALAVPSAANAAYTSSISGGNPTMVGDANGDQLVITVAGANLSHNRAADPGFNSAIDFDSVTGGDQTVANTASVTVNAGDGDDFVQTSPNVDALNGEGGNDRLIGGVGNDTFKGGAGNDVMVWNNGDNNDLMDGEAGGGDETEVNGAVAAGDAFTIVSNGARTRFDRTNLVPFNLDIGETTERLTVNGGGGDDTMGAGGGLNGKIVLSLNGGAGTDGITGGDGSDLITGGDGNDTLNGGDGDDRIVGDRGDDTMVGQNGDDTMVWNNGDNNDKMDGEGGADATEVNGAVAAGDAFVVAPNGQRVKFDRTNLVPFTLDIGSTESLGLSTLGGDDTITAQPGAGSLIGIGADGGSGNDRIDVRDGAPTLVRCGDGNDSGTADGIDVIAPGCEAVERTLVGPPVAIGAARVKAGGRFRKATAPIRLSCPALAAAQCTGKVTLTSAGSLRLGRTKVIAVLGSANYRLNPGQTRTVRVKLPSSLKAIAGRRKSLSIRATAVGRDGSGVLSEATRRLTLTLPKR
jgi:Ca2+-binding RTX toxin-like protein